MSNVLYMVTIEIAPDVETAWDEWNTTHHLPEVLREPGFVRATKYRLDGEAADGWHRWLVVFELDSKRAIDDYLAGEAVKRLRNDHNQRFGGKTRFSRAVGVPVVAIEKPD